MNDPATDEMYHRSYHDVPLDAWSEQSITGIENWLNDIPTARRAYTYTSEEEPDPAQVWTSSSPPNRQQQPADESVAVDTSRPMAKKKRQAKEMVEAPDEEYHRSEGAPKQEPLDEDFFVQEEPFKGEQSRSPSPVPKTQESPRYPPANGVDSPALSALADDNYGQAGFDTRAWANNVPIGVSPPTLGTSPRGSPAYAANMAGLGTSPSGLAFSLAGSPPTGADKHRPSPNEEIRGGFSGASPGVSPRAGYRLPLRQVTDSPGISPRGRPLSMPPNYVPAMTPNHRPQGHFRGISEAEIGIMPSRSTSGKREAQELVVFDQAFYDGNVGDVIVVASHKIVHIHKLERDKLTILGTLAGLRGTVLSAKMLPPAGSNSLEPTIVLAIHGPMMVPSPDGGSTPSKTEAQTTVEVYALKESKLVATLYKSPPVLLGQHAWLSDPATAVGAPTLHVSNRFVTVTSGISGEVYIFELKQEAGEPTFRSLGKTWTSMPQHRQRSYSVSSASSGATGSRDESPTSQNAQEMGIVSLSHRWLAVVPPPASSQTSLHGEMGVARNSAREPPGLMAHTSPAQPSANCEAETPLEETFVNKLARDTAQEALKGARRAGEAGIQAFKNYWNKTDTPPPADANAYSAAYGQQGAMFPPTHAQDSVGRPDQSQTLISIIDLERLSETNDTRPGVLVQPVATFPVRYGCSFLSFDPTGLSLFTSSAKGDVSYVWCLMRMIHGSIATTSGDVAAEMSHASVRQVARYSRFTTSNIVDVVWTRPRGEKLAILTERGTVHIHDLPASAFRWPPAVRHSSPTSTPGFGNDTASQSSQSRGRFGNALSFVSGTAQSLSAAAKYRPSFSGATFSGIAATAGARGSRIVAAGISKSMGAASGTVSNIRHMGENRISLPGGHKARVAAGAVALLSSKYQDAIAITGTGTLRIHAIRLSTTDGGQGKRSVVGEQICRLAVPKLDERDFSQANRDGGGDIRGQWFADANGHGHRGNQTQLQPLSFAEIETSTPYRPFHHDHRVTMNTFVDDAKVARESQEDLNDWVFGEDIETVEVDEDELPTGSMHMDGKGAHGVGEGNDLDEPPPSVEEAERLPSPPPPPAPKAKASKSVKKSSKKSKRPPEPKLLDNLIDVHDEDEDAGVDLGGHGKAKGYEVQDEDDFPFGQNSEFGM